MADRWVIEDADDVKGLKSYLQSLVDTWTEKPAAKTVLAPAGPAPVVVPEYDDRNDVRSGEQILDLTLIGDTPDVEHFETYRVAVVVVDDGDRRMEE